MGKPKDAKSDRALSKLEKKLFKETDDVDDDLEEEDAPPKWYEQFKEDQIDDYKPPSEDELINLRIEAQTVLDEETKFYHSKKGKGKKGSSASWIKTVLSKGTARDKVAAHIVTIQDSPVHNVNHISTLINMTKASKKKECVLVMETLSDLFLEDLLKPDRKLKSFEKQPLSKIEEITSGCARGRRIRLSAWLFEDKLKDLYHQFILALDQIAKDTLEANRIKAVSIMNKLLTGHPEREKELLQLLINKLGDPSQKVVAKVIYCLTQLLRVHPNMKQTVMDEVEKLLFRPNMIARTKYYCICFLSQFIFENKDIQIARNIINIYFSFFKASIKQGEVDSRLMGALLMGVKRAFPFAKDDGSLSKHIDTLYKLVHLTPFNIALHALCLLEQVSKSDDDRFYCALYKKLLDPKLSTSCHHAMLINLLFKSLIKDTNVNRVKAFIKRLFQICHFLPVPVVCGILYFISQLITKRRKDLLSMKMEPAMDQNLEKFDSDDDEEKYFDVDKDEDQIEKNEEEGEGEEEVKEKEKTTHGWVHKDLNKKSVNIKSTLYDSMARNPSYANADKSAYLELVLLSQHFHPTVSLFASKILNNEVISYDGDPLSDFTINRFLERFVFKNPKNVKSEEENGPDPQLASRKYYTPQGAKSMNVTSQDYLSQSERQIPVDELFLYKYLKEKQETRRYEDNEDDDNDSVASEEFEEMLDKMVGRKSDKLDFMDDIGEKLSKKNKTDKDDNVDEEDVEEEESEEEEEDDDDDFSDLDDEADGDEDEIMEFGSGEEFDGDIDIDEALNSKKKKKKTHMFKDEKKKFKKGDGLDSLFAPAEEFAELLEEAGSSYNKPGMISSVSNKDNAGPKQLAWEKKRNHWAKNNRNDLRNPKRKMNQRSKPAKKFKKK